MNHTTFSMQYLRIIGVCLLSIPMLTACFKSDASADDIAVSLHGVNYSDQEFSYSLEDPNDKSNIGGGETIDRYGAGGTMCCYSLPKKWRPGLKVKLDTTHWLNLKPADNLKEVRESHVVDIPSYAKPGEIWVLRQSDGKSTMVMSNFQPDHPNWPGRIKGWPIPSLEYRRERWDLQIKDAQLGVDTAKALLFDLKKNPTEESKDAWSYALEHHPESLKVFSGYDDKRYAEYLKKDYEIWRSESSDRLNELKDQRP